MLMIVIQVLTINVKKWMSTIESDEMHNIWLMIYPLISMTRGWMIFECQSCNIQKISWDHSNNVKWVEKIHQTLFECFDATCLL